MDRFPDRAGRQQVWLWLLSDSIQILILVLDASPHLPVLMGATDEAEHGRGLLLVDAVCEQWGWSSAEDGGGKFVWATARLCSRMKVNRGDNNRHDAWYRSSPEREMCRALAESVIRIRSVDIWNVVLFRHLPLRLAPRPDPARDGQLITSSSAGPVRDLSAVMLIGPRPQVWP